MSRASRLAFLRNIRVLAILVLVAAFVATTAYAVMSDNSVYGLTVKISYASRYCTIDQATSAQTVNFYIVASVWSTSSLHTSINQVGFGLSSDGLNVGSLGETGKSWDPGNGATYQLVFASPALNPLSQPKTSTLVLSLTADVSAGLASARITTSDTGQQTFGSSSC